VLGLEVVRLPHRCIQLPYCDWLFEWLYSAFTGLQQCTGVLSVTVWCILEPVIFPYNSLASLNFCLCEIFWRVSMNTVSYYYYYEYDDLYILVLVLAITINY
jgi:hypothetical protein